MAVHRGEASEKRGARPTVEIGDARARTSVAKQPLAKVIAAIEKDLDDIHQQLDRIEEMIRKVSEENAA